METDDVAKMNDAAVPLHLPGVVTLNSESETGYRATGNDTNGRPEAVVGCVQLSNGIVDVGGRQRIVLCLNIQRDSGRWWASTVMCCV